MNDNVSCDEAKFVFGCAIPFLYGLFASPSLVSEKALIMNDNWVTPGRGTTGQSFASSHTSERDQMTARPA